MSSTTGFRVLLSLRLLGFADTDRVAERSGLEVADASAELRRAESAGWVRRRDGRAPGWLLTGAGRERVGELLAAEHRAAGATEALDGLYRDFLDLNGTLLDLCTRWQVRPDPDGGPPVPNVHDDPAHDAAVIGELDALHEAATPLLEALGRTLERFGGYGDRLGAARDRVVGGDTDWFTRPLVDSYHTVWFELHEDLLATLGRDRGTEAAERARGRDVAVEVPPGR